MSDGGQGSRPGACRVRDRRRRPLADSGAGAGFEAVLAAAAYDGIGALASSANPRRLARAVLGCLWGSTITTWCAV